jgi:crotonobetainyl-CoA:carnitine CoA-transferase CaiB-like acyl-CoA transferase
VGNAPWTRDAKFSSLAARKKHEDELDYLVGEWTVNFIAKEIMNTLQEHGVAAGVVNTPRDLVEDPQLIARNTLWELNHPEMGNYLHLGELFQVPLTPAAGEKAAPCLGEDMEHVCCELLNIPSEEFTELLITGVFE